MVRPSALAGLGKDMQFTADIYPLGIARYMLHVRGTDDFFRDAEAGTLPAFSLVNPDFSAYSKENPQDIQKGESFASAVINAVMGGKGWMDPLLIWVYDEHGGYYDHVPPPPAEPPDDVPGRSMTTRAPRWGGCCGRWPPATPPRPAAGRRAAELRPVRLPGARGAGLPVRPAGLRHQRDLRPLLDPQAGRGEWNLPALTAGTPLPGPARRAGLHRPAGFASAALPGPALRWGSWTAET